jgi:CO/xanthine dehydrogenase FAD-binding subunit
MKPAPFDYVAPVDVGAALAALAGAGGEGRLLAGGQSLAAMMNLRIARPRLLVDLNGIAGLDRITLEADALRIGAMTRQADVLASPEVARYVPLLAKALAHVGHPQTRSRGTVGGSLAHADPAAELPAVAVLLDATLTVAGTKGRRLVSARGFFESAFTTGIGEDEMLEEIAFPLDGAGTGAGFVELSRRRGDFAIVAVAARVRVSGETITDAAVAITGLDDVPVLVDLTAGFAGASLADAAADALAGIEVTASSLHAPPDFRRRIAGVLAGRALAEAVVSAGGRP